MEQAPQPAPPSRDRLEGALAGCVTGALSALPVIAAEYVLVGGRFGDATPTAWDTVLLLIVITPFILVPGLGLGAALGGVWPALRRWWARARLLRYLTIAALGVAALAGVAFVAIVPELLEMRVARVGLLAAGWAGVWLLGTRLLEMRPDARWWWRIAAMLIVLVIWSMHFVVWRWDRSPTTKAAVLNYAPISGAMLGLGLEWTDFDGDGASSMFGGEDCAPFDAGVHPGATDVAGNGVDENCDGDDEGAGDIVARVASIVDHARGAATGRAAREAAVAARDVEQEEAKGEVASPEPGGGPIILITIDTLRADFVGTYGKRPSPTPHLDRFAERAVVYEKAYAQGPLTKASVSSLHAGKYFSEVDRGVEAWSQIYDSNTMLAEKLGELGYTSIAVTSHHYLSKQRGFGQGFEKLINVTKGRYGAFWHDKRSVGEAIKVIERHKNTPRFMLWLHLIDPHHPYVPHKSLKRDDPDGLEGFRPGPDKEDYYWAEIVWTDRQLGRLFKALDKTGLTERALIAIHADHGEGFGEHGYEYHGISLFEDQLRVPLIVKAPGASAGRRAGQVMVLDLHSTIMAFAKGTSIEDQRITGLPEHGRPISLLPSLNGAPLPDRPVFAEMVADKTHSSRKSVIWGRWKLITSYTHNVSSLYDIEADPLEQRNLIGEEPEQARRLSDVLERFRTEGLAPLEPR